MKRRVVSPHEACAAIIKVLEETNATAIVSTPPRRMFQQLDDKDVQRIYEIASAVVSETTQTVAPNVDGQNFYELCQQYRHSKEIMPHPGLPNTVQAFDNLREYIKTGKLPWDSYE